MTGDVKYLQHFWFIQNKLYPVLNVLLNGKSRTQYIVVEQKIKNLSNYRHICRPNALLNSRSVQEVLKTI